MLEIDLLYFEGCPGRDRARALVRRVLHEEGAEARIREINVPGPEEAQRLRFPGSPTIRVNGVDLEGSDAERRLGYGWKCRCYTQSEAREPRAVPSAELIRRRVREVFGRTKGPDHDPQI